MSYTDQDVERYAQMLAGKAKSATTTSFGPPFDEAIKYLKRKGAELAVAFVPGEIVDEVIPRATDILRSGS